MKKRKKQKKMKNRRGIKIRKAFFHLKFSSQQYFTSEYLHIVINFDFFINSF